MKNYIFSFCIFMSLVWTSCTVSKSVVSQGADLAKYKYVAVIDNGTYRIKIFNNQGKAVTERIEPEKNIFPISIDISDDNTTFAISYIDTTDIEAVSKVVFFYVNGSDGEYIDNMFGAVEKQDEYIAYISFMDNDKLVAVTDTSVFAMNITGKEIWSYDLPNKLDRVSLSCKDYVALACGESFNGKDGYSNGTVVFLNMNGNEI